MFIYLLLFLSKQSHLLKKKSWKFVKEKFEIRNSLLDLVNSFTNCHNYGVWHQRLLEARSNSVPQHSCGAKCRKDQVSTRHVCTKPKSTRLRMQFETSRVMSLVVLKGAYYLHLCVCTYVLCELLGHWTCAKRFKGRSYAV